jgi:photosystem II stability/assembly factor-like uncharacterized protein
MNVATAQRCLLLLFALSWNPLNAVAQDDPRFDNAIGVLPPEAFLPRATPPVLTVITSADGYDNFDLGVDFAEPHMASNPLDPLQYFNAFNTNGTHHTENGHDWASHDPVFPTAAGDPVVAYDSLGNLYYINMRIDGGNITGSWVVKSTDNGTTWGTAVSAISGFDKCWIAADQTNGPYQGYVYATMTASGGGNFSRSTNGGTSWTTTWTFATQTLPGMMVAVGPDGNIPGGNVYVVTNSGSSTASTYTFYRSTDGGATFQFMSSQNWAGYLGLFYNGRNSVEGVRTRPYPFIAADNSNGPYRGRLYCVYATNNPPGNGNKPDIYCRYSTDQGTTWSSEVIINDDPDSENNHNWFPAIWCDVQTGRLYAKWFDSRNSAPLDDSTDVYASYSDDGGITWAPNQRTTNEIFKTRCLTCGGGGDPAYQGDYDAITSNEYGAMAVWTDFRDGNFKSMTAYFPDFAMLVSPTADTSGVSDSLDVMVHIPDVKLYTHSVRFSATVQPAANFTLAFPDGDSLTSYPDSLPVHIVWDNVPEGVYAVTITGEGPNGTPVHRRTVTVLATSPFITVLQPNGGEGIFGGTFYPISWADALVDTVNLEYSTDGGTTWLFVADSVQSRRGDYVPPKARGGLFQGLGNSLLAGEYLWQVPFTFSEDCLIRVSDYSDGSVNDVSDAAFSIVEAPASHWVAHTSPNTQALFSISVIDTSRAWAAGAGGTAIKTISGNTWISSISPGGEIYNIEAIDISKVLVATYSAGTAKIRRTQNSGLSWTDVYTDSSPGAFIDAIKMFDGTRGYAVGDPVGGFWTLLKTTDGGLTWSNAATLAQNGTEVGWNNAMWWSDTLHGWFGTNNGRIYYTIDGGASWNSGTTPFTNSFGVAFLGDHLTGIAAGDAAALSLDGGATWASTGAQLPGSASATTALNLGDFIPGLDPTWYLTSGSSIYKTDDQGTTFTLDHSQPNFYNHVAMRVVDVGGNDWLVGYAVGDNGTITKYTELLIVTDVRQVSADVPSRFSLRQNYPNPFNPTTTLAYDLPEKANVRLQVYDVLGQLVRTVVDAPQEPGEYEAVWDGLSFSGNHASSGVYFYRLDARTESGGGFTDFKKMLLMK